MDEITINQVKKENILLPEQVANEIIQFIIDNQLKPGYQLPSEMELCTYLGVGRGTVREAIKLLISKNILVIKRGKGTYVANQPGVVEDPWGFAFVQDKHKLAKDLWEMRLFVEPGVASLAAERATEKDIKELRKLAVEIERLIKDKKPHEELDIKLHEFIASVSKNDVAQHIIPLINYGVRMFVERTKSHLLNETIVTHKDIVEAIASHNKEDAYRAMKNHITMNINYIENNEI